MQLRKEKENRSSLWEFWLKSSFRFRQGLLLCLLHDSIFPRPSRGFAMAAVCGALHYMGQLICAYEIGYVWG